MAKHRRESRSTPGPVRYPAPERSFVSYPSEWIDDTGRLRTADDALPRLSALLTMPLTNLAAERRCADPGVLAALLRASTTPRSVGDLAGELVRTGTAPEEARATVAWMLKYDLLTPEIPA